MSIPIHAQSIRITYDPGFGTYSMANMRAIQDYTSKHINGLPIQKVVQFPGYINHSASVGFYLDKNILIGINAAYVTTGGRNHLSDYSGEYKMDMILNGYQLGIDSEYIFNLSKKVDFNANFKVGYIRSTLDVNEFLSVYNVDSKNSKEHLSQDSFFLEPNVSLSYNIIRGIEARLGIGYNLDTSVFDNKMIDWSGLRTKIGVSYSF